MASPAQQIPSDPAAAATTSDLDPSPSSTTTVAAAPSSDDDRPKAQVQVQVQGRVLQADWALLQHFTTVTQFLTECEGDECDATEPAAPTGTFCLPDWLSLTLWEQLLTYPGLHLPPPSTLQPPPSTTDTTPTPEPQACTAFLLAYQASLHDIARAAEFLGCGPLMELASAACLLRLRPVIASSAADVAALSDASLVSQATTASHTHEELQLLFHPSDHDLDVAWMSRVVRVPLEQFWPLVDRLVLADVVPAAGVVPGLIRALVWPCISKRRDEEILVVGQPGKGHSGEYLNLYIPAKVLLAYDARVLVCNVKSHDQGWGGSPQDKNTYNGSWTFGTLEVNGEQQDGRLYTNLTACHAWQQHTKVMGAGSSAIRALAGFAEGLRGQGEGEGEAEGEGGEEGGDVGAHISITMHAFFKGWKNSVAEAELECFFLPKGNVAGGSS